MRLDLEGVHPHWIAAAVGSLVALKALPGASKTEKVCNVAAGFSIAAYAGPAIIEWLPVTSPNIGAGIVFGVGACGLVLFNSLIAAIRATDFGAWLAAWMPRRKE